MAKYAKPASAGSSSTGPASKDKKASAQEDAIKARHAAEKDIDHDPELSDPDPTDDLDEGELARKDNTAEDAQI